MPGMAPALPSIVAKLLVIVERILDCFVNVQMLPTTGECCEVAQFTGELTPVCGVQLVELLSGGLTAIAGLGVYLVGALGVWMTPV